MVRDKATDQERCRDREILGGEVRPTLVGEAPPAVVGPSARLS
jgi:hypothetical protein